MSGLAETETRDVLRLKKERRANYKNGKSLILYKTPSSKWMLEKVISTREIVNPTGVKVEIPLSDNPEDIYSIETNSDLSKLLIVYKCKTGFNSKIFNIEKFKAMKELPVVGSNDGRGSLVCAKWAPYSPNVLVLQYTQRIYVDEVTFDRTKGEFVHQMSDEPIIEIKRIPKNLHEFTWVDHTDMWLKYAIWCPFDRCIKTPIIPKEIAIPIDEYTKLQMSLSGPFAEKLATKVKTVARYEIYTREEHLRNVKLDGLDVDKEKDKQICSVEILGAKVVVVLRDLTDKSHEVMSLKYFDIPSLKSPVYNDLCFLVDTETIHRVVPIEFAKKPNDDEDPNRVNCSYSDARIWRNKEGFWLSLKPEKVSSGCLWVFGKSGDASTQTHQSYNPLKVGKEAQHKQIDAVFGYWGVHITLSNDTISECSVELEKGLLYSSTRAKERIKDMEKRKRNLLISMVELQNEVYGLKKLLSESVDIADVRKDAEKILRYLERPYDFTGKKEIGEDIRKMEVDLKVRRLGNELDGVKKGQDVAKCLEELLEIQRQYNNKSYLVQVQKKLGIMEQVKRYAGDNLLAKGVILESDEQGLIVNGEFVYWQQYINSLAKRVMEFM